MNNEQERKDFEAWYEKEFPYEPIPIRAAEGYFHRYDNKLWNAYQAGRAALQSQDREDTARLDWIEANHGCDITEFVGGIWEVNVPDGPFGVRNSMREAIDHARRGEGEG